MRTEGAGFQFPAPLRHSFSAKFLEVTMTAAEIINALPDAYQTTLRTWVNDPDEWLSRHAQHPDTSPAVLQQLADYPDKWTRRYVAENPNTLPAVLQQLANDADEWVRLAVVRNPNTPPDLLAVLVQDLAPDVQRTALRVFQIRP
jgi:hypothetical protein